MRLLITGGLGFIGSHLVEAYLCAGHEVYVIDDLSTGNIDNLQVAKSQYPSSLFISVDTILNPEIMSELIGICDCVLHLAAAVGVQYILDNPLSSIVTNIQGTEMVLSLCNKFKKKVLIVSTSEVYGKHKHAPLLETDDIIYGPSTKFRWSYAAAKLMDEFTALAYYRTNGLPVVIVRLFNTVGPRQIGRYGMVIPRFVDTALRNETIKVYGDGQQTRTFIHVADVVSAITKLVESESAIGDVFNIGGREEITISRLAQEIVDKTQSKSTIDYVPYDEVFSPDFEDMRRRVPSIDKITNTIEWTPERSLDHMLRDVIRSYDAK